MENKSFDHIIKNKLDQFTEELDHNAWDLFQEGQINSDFDNAVSSEIEQYSVEVAPNAWTLFQESEANFDFDHTVESKLDNFNTEELPTDFDALTEKMPSGFDALIGAKLATASTSDGSDWEEFEKILDQDAIFDKQVSDAVEGYQSPANESQWPKLAAHLEKVEKRRRRIVITKLIEAAVFLLFILTIMQLYPIQNINKQQVFRTIGVQAGLNSSNLTAGDLLRKNERGEKNHAAPASLITSNLEPVSIKELSTITTGGPRSSYRQTRSTTAIPSMKLKEIVAEKNKILTSISSDEKRHFDKEIQAIEFNALFEDKALATLDIKSLELADKEFSYLFDGLSSLVKKNQYWFNVYGSPEVNLISTPYDRSYSEDRYLLGNEVDAYAHAAHGYTIGASLSKETTNYEIEGGLEYTSLNYHPKEVYEYTGRATTGITTRFLKEIIFNIVELPLSLKYTVFRKKGWKVYGKNGISAGMVAFANYDIDEKTSRPLVSLEVARNSKIGGDDSFVNRKKFDPGFIRSGSVSNNIFATVSAGFGVSKEISEKISFYVQPTYYHNLSVSGLGPNNDVHHRLSMQIGTKVRI